MDAFRDCVVVVTGAGRGIGRALAGELAGAGARVGAIDLHADRLDRLRLELGSRRFASAVADVTDAEAMRQAVAELEAALGSTDVLIANAGIVHETSAQAFAVDAFTAEIRVNLLGVANSFAAVLPGMCQRQRGHLVAMSSAASYRGMPLLAGYCASKAGVNALCDAFRVELRPHGIRVTTICPGFIKTDLAAHMNIPVPPAMLAVDDAVRKILNAIARGKSFYAFPRRDVWRTWLLRHLPRGIGDWLAGRYHRQLLKARDMHPVETSGEGMP